MLVIASQLAYSQDYVFDRLVQYEENGENTVQLFFNTQNPNYHLYLYDDDESEFADLYDKETKKIHHFSVEPFQENSSAAFSYLYENSDKLFAQSSAQGQLSYEFKTKRQDKYYQFTDLNVFRKDEQKPFLSADLVMRYSEENLFNSFNACCLLGYELSNTIQTEENFVVIRATITEEDGEKTTYRLIDDQVIQFKLVVKKVKKNK